MRSLIARSISAVGACVLLVVSTQCSVAVSNPGKTGSTAPASATIGAAGGSVTSSDGHLQMSVPANALASNVTITVSAVTQAGSVGTAYDIEPTGTQFAVPVTMTIDYAGEDIGTTSPADLQIAVYATSGWQALVGQSLDTANETVSGTTTHLSTYGLTAQGQTQLCVSATGGWGCAGSGGAIDAGVLPDSGVSGSSGGSSGSSSGGSCPAPTCASLNPCGGYVGATVGSCNVGTSSWQATCCFAAGAPVCVSVGAGGGCASADAGVAVDGGAGSGSSGGSSSSSGGGGCAAPTCADAVCPGGTTLQSCTNTSDGYTASCCYAAGVVPTGGGSTDAGVGSSSGGSAGDAGFGGSSGGSIDAGSGSSSGGAPEDGGASSGGGGTDAGSGAADAGAPVCGGCDTDAECQATCPPVQGGTNCCDTGSHTCFASAEPTCPVPADE